MARDPLHCVVLGRAGLQRGAERFIRTLEEESLYIDDSKNLEGGPGGGREVIDECVRRCKHGWLPERHGYRTPVEVRQALARKAV